MLDIMRKHTRSWVIKIIFTAIILSFIFFFGYSQMQRGGAGTSVAATVNGEAIPMGEYKIALTDAREFYRNMFKNEIPEQMWPQIRQSALLKVISQALMAQFAETIGFHVTDLEIYELIQQNPNFQKDGIFSPSSYKTVFLPYFERRFGLNYEDLLRQEMMAAKGTEFIMSQVTVVEAEAKQQFMEEKTKWTFERITIPKTAAEGVTYDKTPAEIAGELHELLSNGKKREISKITKKYKLTDDELKEVTIQRKAMLIPSADQIDLFEELFSLTKENPIHKGPMESGESFYIFKLVKIEKPSESEWEKEKIAFISDYTNRAKQEELREWQERLRNEASIEEYVLSAER